MSGEDDASHEPRVPSDSRNRTPAATRRRRLTEALRRNLRRRKQAERSGEGEPADAPTSGEPD